MQGPQRQRALQVLDRDSANAHLGASRTHQRRHAVNRIALTVTCDGRAARVVAVEARPAVHVELRSTPGSERDAALWADEASAHRAAVGGVQCLDSEA